MNKRKTFTLKMFLLLVLISLVSPVSASQTDDRDACLRLIRQNPDQIRWTEDETGIGTLRWKLSRMPEQINTFERQIFLAGSAQPGMSVMTALFVQERGEIRLWNQQTTTIGPSGLFQTQEMLPTTGRQFLLILYSNDKVKEGGFYTITRWSEAARRELTDLRINLYEAVQQMQPENE